MLENHVRLCVILHIINFFLGGFINRWLHPLSGGCTCTSLIRGLTLTINQINNMYIL